LGAWGSAWIGALDELAIRNRVLSGAEMLYLAGHRAKIKAEA